MGIGAGTGIREHNRDRVIAAFELSVATSRTEISARTGLSRATVASIVEELLKEGAVHPLPRGSIAPAAPRSGRPAELLTLTREERYGVALDIAHESIRAAITGPDGTIRAHMTARIPGETTPDAAIDVARELTVRTLERAGVTLAGAVGVVAAVPDPIDRLGNVARPDPLSRWNGLNPSHALSAAFGVPVIAENDANLAVIGEHLYGAARGLDDLIFVKVAHGVGTGILVNGGLVRGSDGLAGEVGHIQVRPDGHICTCGNRGCLFTLVTGHYLGPLLGDASTGMDTLSSMAARDDPGARRLLVDAGYEVGKVLANLANTLNPAAVILGGRFAHAGDGLLEGFRDAMQRFAEPQVARGLTITRTTLSESAELLGAAAVASGIVPAPRTLAAPIV